MHLLLLSLFSSLLLVFSFPTFDLFPLAWIALIPFFFIIRESKNQKQLLFFSFLTHFLFWCGLIYWLHHVSWFGYLSLSLVLALYSTPIAWFCHQVRLKRRWSFIWSAPFFWVAFEYIRTSLFTGFPWGFLGSTQYLFLPFIQIAEWTGVYGVSFLVVLGNAWIFEILSFLLKKRKRLNLFEWVIPPLLICGCFVYGVFVLSGRSQTDSSVQKKISLIQGNIPQDVKWNEAYEQYIQDEYARLSAEAIQIDKPDLVIWPETAIPAYLRYSESWSLYLKKIIDQAQTPFLVGASDAWQKVKQANGKLFHVLDYYNSAFLIYPDGSLDQKYNKIHLVPFGEYVPFTSIPWLNHLTPIQENYSSGEEYTVFDYAIPFSVVICFEDVFPDLVRRFVKNGAKCLINLTNDGWFKDSSAPMQHAVLALFRAVENRVWLVRSTNTGVSCFIDPFGRIVKQVENQKKKNIWVSGIVSHTIEPGITCTFYTRYGDLFSWLAILIGIILVCFCIRKQGGKAA